MNDPVDTIAYCHACKAPMDVSAIAPFSQVACPSCGEHTRVKAEFGPYTLKRRHAVGGMSMVFGAYDNTLNRDVAVKILSESYSADEKRIAAFEEEARITASFSHPNVVRVLKTGHAFGRYYIAMEFVGGGHFEHHIRERGRIPEQEIIPLAIEIAHGLRAAHKAGLIHRDVKPGNILLDTDGHAKLVDFGLALVTHGGTATADELWATPYYVPPETIEGHAEDFRSDLYAFGATLYHALAGKPPCNEESMNTERLREAKKNIIPLHQACPDLSQDLCDAVDRAMAYYPEHRYPSYDDLIRDLTQVLTRIRHGDPSTPSSRRAHKKLLKKRYLFTATVATLAVLGLSTLAIKRYQANHHSNTNEPAPDPEHNPQDQEAAAEMARTFRDAQSRLNGRDYHRAAALFSALFHNPRYQEPSRTWVGIQALSNTLLTGKIDESKKLSSELVSHCKSGNCVLSPTFAKSLQLIPTLEAMPCPNNPAPYNNNAEFLMHCFIAGLKNWQSGMPDAALRCFQQAANIKLTPAEAWASPYQKLVQDFQKDAELLKSPLFTQNPNNPNACEDAIKELSSLKVKCATQGRIQYNISVRIEDLQHLAQTLSQCPTPPPTQPTPPRPDPTRPSPPKPAPPALSEVLPKFNQFCSQAKFSEAVQFIKSLPTDPVGAKKDALINVTQSAEHFLKDLEENLATEAISIDLALKSGKTITRITFKDKKLIAKTSSDELITPQWTDFSPNTLIELHRYFIKANPSESDRNSRNERAICYLWLLGDRQSALTAADKLSQSSPTFKRNWDRLLTGLPQ